MTVRRKFLIALVGSALAAPPTPFAQQPARVRRIGLLWEVDNPRSAQNLDAFNVGLRELGYVQGRDYVIEQRSAKGDPRLLKQVAAELLALKVDLIIATSGMATRRQARRPATFRSSQQGSAIPLATAWLPA